MLTLCSLDSLGAVLKLFFVSSISASLRKLEVLQLLLMPLGFFIQSCQLFEVGCSHNLKRKGVIVSTIVTTVALL